MTRVYWNTTAVSVSTRSLSPNAGIRFRGFGVHLKGPVSYWSVAPHARARRLWGTLWPSIPGRWKSHIKPPTSHIGVANRTNMLMIFCETHAQRNSPLMRSPNGEFCLSSTRRRRRTPISTSGTSTSRHPQAVKLRPGFSSLHAMVAAASGRRSSEPLLR